MPRRPLRRRILAGTKLLLALAATLALLELGMRWLLFSESAPAGRWAARLRDASLFADSLGEDEYWKLRHRFGREEAKPVPNHDATLGWIRRDVTPGTYEHRDETRVRGRRPLLLYGDSFANCVPALRNRCWQQLLEQSPAGRRYRMINYGTGGYGFDQIVLLMLLSLDRFADRDPLVVVSLLADGDLQRSTLRFRDWPKAHFALVDGGGVELDSGALPRTSLEYLERHPLGIESYLWRYLVHGTQLLPSFVRGPALAEERRTEHQKRLNRELLELAVGELEKRGLDYFFLVFHSRRSLGAEWCTRWEDEFLWRGFEELDVPFVSVRPLMLEAASRQGRDPQSFYIDSGKGLNHLTAEGNEVAFEAFLRGIGGRFDEPASLRVGSYEQLLVDGAGGAARYEIDPDPRQPSGLARRLLLGVGAGRTQLSYALRGAARFTGTLTASAGGEGAGGGAASLEILCDGATRWEGEVSRDGSAVDIDVDLAGARELLFSAAPVEGRPPCDVAIVEPRLELARRP